jgi:protoporphyrinogen/coproporphyrinogen III oxidase
MTPDRIIIGGGFAGLLAARAAAHASEKVVVLEASPQWGGAIGRGKLAGLTLDTGAEAFSTMGEAVSTLVVELGLSDEVRRPRDVSPVIASTSGFLPIPHGVMGIPADLEQPSLTAAFGHEVMAEATRLDSLPLAGEWETHTVASVVESRLGPVIASQVVTPVVSAIYGHRALDCTLAELLPALAVATKSTGSLSKGAATVRGNSPGPGSAVATLRGGLHTLVDALVSDCSGLGVTMINHKRVSALSRVGKLWRAVTPSGSWEAPHLTLACGPVTTGLLLSGDQALRAIIDRLHWQDTTIVLASVVDSALNSYPLGSGAIVATDFAGDLHATTHANAKWEWLQQKLAPNQHVVRLSFGKKGSHDPKRMRDLTLSALAEVYGVAEENVGAILTTRWHHNLLEHSPGSRQARVDLTELAKEQGITICGTPTSGNGLLAIAQDLQQKDSVWPNAA